MSQCTLRSQWDCTPVNVDILENLQSSTFKFCARKKTQKPSPNTSWKSLRACCNRCAWIRWSQTLWVPDWQHWAAEITMVGSGWGVFRSSLKIVMNLHESHFTFQKDLHESQSSCWISHQFQFHYKKWWSWPKVHGIGLLLTWGAKNKI